MNDLFADAVRQVLLDHCTPQLIRSVEAGNPPTLLWQNLEEAGFADALVPENLGGAGLVLAEVYSVLELCGEFALPVPFGETLMARGVISAFGLKAPKGSISFGNAHMKNGDQLCCDIVRGGNVADWVLVNYSDESRLLPQDLAEAGTVGFCLDASLTWPEKVWQEATLLSVECDWKSIQAALYSALIAGALLKVLAQTLQYANERQQFGKPIGKFQAIQHQLSIMSEHTFAARMAAQLGLHKTGDGSQPDRLRAAIAKARTSEAALEVAALSHSICGAIGFTSEFDLQLYTRRLHAWRQAAGSESYWHDVVGAAYFDSDTGPGLDLIRTATDVA